MTDSPGSKSKLPGPIVMATQTTCRLPCAARIWICTLEGRRAYNLRYQLMKQVHHYLCSIFRHTEMQRRERSCPKPCRGTLVSPLSPPALLSVRPFAPINFSFVAVTWDHHSSLLVMRTRGPPRYGGTFSSPHLFALVPRPGPPHLCSTYRRKWLLEEQGDSRSSLPEARLDSVCGDGGWGHPSRRSVPQPCR